MSRWRVALPAGVLLLVLSGAARAQEATKTGNTVEYVAPEVAAADPGTGFEGRVVINGQVLPGARVFAYKTFQDLLAHRPLTASGITADDGAWRIDVPRGRYYLLAKKLAAGADDGPVRAGDSSAYHGSNPITAVPGKYTHVGFSMEQLDVDVLYEESARTDTGSLSGVVTSGGEPLEGATVSLFPDAAGDFRGLGIAILPPTGKSGAFQIDTLPEADYFVIVRKRASRKPAGPVADGDFFGYFAVNPVRVRTGKMARIRVAAVAKASEIGKDDSLFRDTGTQITGRVTDREGHAVPGVYAFAYEEKTMALKRPAAISRVVDADGRYVLNLPRGGVFFLGARSDYGDTPGSGEWYGRYEGTADHSIEVDAGNSRAGIDITVEKIRPTLAVSPPAWFLDVTETSGLPSLRYGEGVNFHDLDGDGLPELFLTVARGRDRLFQNIGGCRFRDVTEERGIRTSGGMGAGFGDLDEDGRVDLYVVRGEHVQGANTLYLQRQDGTFVDQSAAAGAPGRSSGMAALLADLDGDGALDILTSGTSFTALYHNVGKPGSPAFIEAAARNGIEEKGRGWGLLATDFDGDSRPDLVLAQGAPGSAGGVKLYRNRGDGTFEDWTARSGVAGIAWAMGAVSADFDGDGDFDLFVTNFDGPDRLYRNDGKGVFTDITALSGIGSGHSVGASAGCVDGDLLPDLVVAQFQGPVRLYRNLGGGRFAEVSAPESGLGPFKRNDGIALADVDGDGDLDLYVTNFEGGNRLYKNILPAGRSLKILPAANGPQSIGAVARLYDAGGLGKSEALRATAELQANYGLLSQGPLEIIFRLPDDGPYDLTLTYPDGTVIQQRAVRPGVLTLGGRNSP